jgi:pyruvate,water dikinase
MRLVAWLTEFGRDDGALAGGKGANLGELLRAGLPVPPGFVVTTAAYRQFVAVNSLQPRIEQLAQAATPGQVGTLESAARAIAALFADAALPDAISTAVGAYRRLPHRR